MLHLQRANGPMDSPNLVRFVDLAKLELSMIGDEREEERTKFTWQE